MTKKDCSGNKPRRATGDEPCCGQCKNLHLANGNHWCYGDSACRRRNPTDFAGACGSFKRPKVAA